MSVSSNPITADQLLGMPDDGKRYELLEGVIQMMSPAGGRHGSVAFDLAFALGQHVKSKGLGSVFAAETGFLISTDPDTVRAPDVAFVRHKRMQELENLDGYLPLAPDLVGEVVSPNDSTSEVEAKSQMWLAAGVRMVLVVDPANETIRVYCTPSQIDVFHHGDTIDATDVVEGWKLKVADVFPD
jgi:Uma2 family endonuclease